MATCGFYGKLPGEGDFVTRRLPWEFTSAWDDWLQQGMQASRGTLGDAWLKLYLSAPIWRFQLAPGICGPLAWRGLFFASVDRVGRYFPLTLAFSGGSAPAPGGVASTLAGDADGWLAAEDAGLAGLVPRLLLDDFDRAVQALSEPAADPVDAVPPAAVHLYCAASEEAPPLRLAFPALPPAAQFTALIAPSAPPPSSSLLDTLAS